MGTCSAAARPPAAMMLTDSLSDALASALLIASSESLARALGPVLLALLVVEQMDDVQPPRYQFHGDLLDPFAGLDPGADDGAREARPQGLKVALPVGGHLQLDDASASSLS